MPGGIHLTNPGAGISLTPPPIGGIISPASCPSKRGFGTTTLKSLLKPVSVPSKKSVGAILIVSEGLPVGGIDLVDPGIGIGMGGAAGVAAIYVTSVTSVSSVSAIEIISLIEPAAGVPSKASVGTVSFYGYIEITAGVPSKKAVGQIVIVGEELEVPPPEGPPPEAKLISSIIGEWEIIKVLSKTVDASIAWTPDPVILGKTYAGIHYISVRLLWRTIPLGIHAVHIGGIDYQRVNSVYEASTENKSFYYDRVAGMLYVKVEAGININARRVACYGSIPISTRVVHDNANGIMYWPIIADNLDSFTQRKSCDPFGRTQNADGGSIVLTNGDGALDDITREFHLRGGSVRIKQRMDTDPPTFPLATYAAFGKKKVGKVAWDENFLTLHLNNPANKLLVVALQDFIESENDPDYPEQDTSPTVDKSVEGEPTALVIGDHDDAPPPDKRENWYKSIRARLWTQGTPSGGGYINQEWRWAVRRKDKQTGEVNEVKITRVYIMRQGNIIFVESNKWAPLKNETVVKFVNKFLMYDGDQVGVVGTGLKDDPTGKYTGVPHGRFTKAADIIHFFDEQAGILPVEMDIPSYDACRGTPPWSTSGTWNGDMKMWNDRGTTTFRDLVEGLEQSIGAIQQVNADGLFHLSFISHRIASTDITLNADADLTDWSQVQGDNTAVSRVVIEHKPSPQSGELRVVKNARNVMVGILPVLDNPAENEMMLEREEHLTCYHKKKSDAKERANYLFTLFKNGPEIVNCVDVTGKTLRSMLFDRVIVTKRRGLGGPIISKPYWIIGHDPHIVSGATKLDLLEIGINA